MKISFTSQCWEEVIEKVRGVRSEMTTVFGSLFDGISYGAGIDEFTVAIVSVSADPAKNARFIKPNDKVGRFKDPLTGETVRYITIAFPIDPDDLAKMDADGLRGAICDFVLQRLEDMHLRIPREFDFKGFATHLSTGIEIYRKSRNV